MKTTTTSTQTEALIMKEKMKLFRPKFRKGKTKTKTGSSAADGNHTSSLAKQIGCFPKWFACGAKQQLQLQPQQAPKDEMRQEPDSVIEMEDVQATKKAVDDEQLAEERIPAEEENDEEVSEKGQEEDVKESKFSTAADIDTTPNSDALTSKVIGDKAEDADNEHAVESKDYIPKPDEQPEEAVAADDGNNKVSSKEEGAVEDSRETINSMTTTTNANMMMDNARVAMETAMCTFTNALETAMSSMSSHKGGGADDNDHQQDKSASESSSPEGPKDVGTAGERQPEDNNVSVDPLEKQASIKPKVVAENHEESTTDSSNNKNKRPPLMPPSKLQNTNKTKVEKKTKAAASKGNNALKNLKASLTRSSKKEESLSPTVGPDSVKSWPMAQKKKTVSRFRKTGSNRRAALKSAAAATTKPDVQKKGEEEEEGSTKGENSTLATPNTTRRNEAETTAADGQVDGKDDIPTDVDVRHSSRDDEIETSIPIWSPDNFVFNCTHTLSSRCSLKDKKEETALNKNEEANKFVPSGSQKSLSSRTGEEEKSNPVTTAVGMGGAIGSAVSLFMRSLAANPHKEESKKMDSEAIASAPNSKTTPETEKVVDASCQEQQGNSGGVASAGSSCAKEKSLRSEEVSRSGSEKGKDATMEKLTSDSKENESFPVVADQPEPEGPVSTKVSGEEETTDNESSSKGNITTSDAPIIATVDETPKSDDVSRSSPILPEQQEQTDLALDTVSKKNSNGSMTDAVTSVNRNPIDGDTLKGVENEIPLQGLQILQSSSSAADDQEQRQEDDGERSGGENLSEGDHEGTSKSGKGAEKEANGSNNNIDNTTVMRSELLEGKVSFGRSNSNISSISVDKNAMAATAVDKNAMAATAAIDHKTQKAEDEGDVDEQREDPVSNEGSREEVIVDATRKFTDTYAMVNRERKKQALSELRRSTYLDSLATSHAIVMAELLTLGHSVDSLAALQDQLHSDDVGENIQRGTDERAMHKLAMEAGTSSRYNILRPTYKQYGMGTAVGEDGMVYMVQLFRGPVKEAFHQVERPEPSSVWCSSLWC